MRFPRLDIRDTLSSVKVLESSRFTRSWPFTTAIMTMLLWFAQSLRNGSSTASTLFVIVLLGVWALYAHWLAAQRVSEASLTIQQSSVRVRGEKVSRTLRPKDIRSSTTALHRDGGYDVALELRGTRDPIVLQGLNDEEFRGIKESLGLLQSGEGTLLWRSAKRLAVASWAFAIVLSVLFWWAGGANTEPPGPALVLLPWILVALILATSVKRSSLRMHAHGIEICDAKGKYRPIRWDEIQSVSREGDELSFRIAGEASSLRLGLSQPILDAILAQLNAALVRSRVPVPLTTATEVLASLHRSKNESAAEWIARIDALEVGESSYRRAAALPVEALRSAIDDPDLEPEIRGAAARILLRVDASHRERIELALSRVHAQDKREEIVVLSQGDAVSVEKHQSRKH